MWAEAIPCHVQGPHSAHYWARDDERDEGRAVYCPGVRKAQYQFPTLNVSDIAGPNAEVIVNEKGGGQSHLPARFDLVDGKAMFAMCQVLHTGAEKYGANNWRKIDIDDHLNHLLMHVYAYLAGDESDDHLSHIMCRAMFAQAVYFQDHPEET